jgi:hypothetical protein
MDQVITQRAGPYEVEAWWDPKRDLLNIKVREWRITPGDPRRRKFGFIAKLTPAVLRELSSEVPEANEYPTVAFGPAVT